MKYANISKNPCDQCQKILTDWDYKYQGKHYCKECYNLLFTFQICSICGKRKKISNDLQVPICKVCQVKDKPCIRCSRDKYKFGLITKDGPVCKTCAVYFREYKICSVCHISYYTVSERKLLNGNSQLLCHRCYNKTLPICSLCHKQRKAYTYDEKLRAICELCATKENKQCIQCGEIISAGRGNLCQECTYVNTLTKRIKFGVTLLSSKYMGEYFEKFGWWLKDRRGSVFAATHLIKYLDFFSQIDTLCERLGAIPTYKEVVHSFSVAMSRKNLLVITFLSDIGLLIIDKVCQEEQANKDMIDRYFKKFKQGSWESKILKAYYEHLRSKTKHKGSIRSIRLALGSAVKLLEYKGCFDDRYLTNNILDGYLWKYPGKKCSLSGFVKFLKDYNFNIVLDSMKPKIYSDNKKTAHLKSKLLIKLRYLKTDFHYLQQLLIIMIEFLHNVKVPKNVIFFKNDFKVIKGNLYITVALKKFYLPCETKLILDNLRYKKELL